MIIIGADHAGFELKNQVKFKLKELNIDFLDVTDYEIDLNDDYVDVAESICKEVLKDSKNFGIAICGTGIGISIACNKIKGIIAGNCLNTEVAKLLKEHNNCNVICFGGRLENNIDDIIYSIEEFTKAEFKDIRHKRRVDKIKKLEEKFGEN